MFWAEDEYLNGQDIRLVSKYSGNKEVYTQLIIFHSIYFWNNIFEVFYCKWGLMRIGSRFLKDDEYSNGQVIWLVYVYSRKKKACAQLVLFHPWRRQFEFGRFIKLLSRCQIFEWSSYTDRIHIFGEKIDIHQTSPFSFDCYESVWND